MMQLIEKIVDKIIEEKLSIEDCEFIDKNFRESETEINLIFQKKINSKIPTICIKTIIDNLNCLSNDAQFHLKYDFYRSYFNYWFDVDKEKIFTLALKYKEFYNNIFFFLEEEDAAQIVKFIQQWCVFANKSLKEECLLFLNKTIGPLQGTSDEFIRLLSNEIKYSLFEETTKNFLYRRNSIIWTKLDAELSGLNDNFLYRKYVESTICDSENLCLYLDKVPLGNFDDSYLKYLLLDNFDKCKLTIEKIIQKCVLEKQAALILQMSFLFSERFILDKLIKIGDKIHIVNFIKNKQSLKDFIVYY